MKTDINTRPNFKIALVQMRVVGGAKEENLRRAEAETILYADIQLAPRPGRGTHWQTRLEQR